MRAHTYATYVAPTRSGLAETKQLEIAEAILPTLPQYRRKVREYSPYSACESMSDESDKDVKYEMAKSLYQTNPAARSSHQGREAV